MTAAEPDSRRTETVVILDFGSQYSQLIARRVRECQVYCELLPFDAPREAVERLRPRAFILSGGPASVYEPGAPLAPAYVFAGGVPVLGICYGMQLIAHQLGGAVERAERREYGHAEVVVGDPHGVFEGLPRSFPVWMSHGDSLTVLPPGFRSLAHTASSAYAAMGNGKGVVGLQFHPEVAHTPLGKEILRNFLFRVCGLRGDWTPGHFIAEAVERIRTTIGPGRAICALSGGVDSAVAATLTHRAIGDQLTCVFVDNGLLRQGEAEQVIQTFRERERMRLIHVDARERFLGRLAGVEDPERKRRIIGEEFIRVF
ncbi:MAG: glutamine-hydrolyzing GMP synthase, partial [Chloroflexi bacterium]|nr:glutamine-hydrolyzing GMP synthase [Chloroflexota bacterium]